MMQFPSKGRGTSLHMQDGIAMLEALISIVILSLGVLAIIGLQAVSVRLSSDAKYRSDAALAANQLVGQMWVGDKTLATMQAAFQTGGSAYGTWSGNLALPGADVNPPTVVFGANGLVTITVFWQQPGEPLHQHRVVTQLVGCSGIC